MYNSAKAVLKGVNTNFYKQIGDFSSSLFAPFYFKTQSDSDKEDYIFVDAFPGIEEWKDQINGEPVKDYLYTIRNKPWNFGFLVNRYTIKDSKTTLGANIELNLRQSLRNWGEFPDDLISELIDDNGNCFDGSALFANSRNLGGTGLDNLLSGNGVTLAGVTTDLAASRNAMYGMKNSNKRPFNRSPRFAVLIPPHLHDVFLTLRNSQTVTTGTSKTNIYNNSFDIILRHQQSSTDNDWFLLNTQATIPPFILQENEGPQWKMIDKEDELHIKYFSTARLNAGYGNPTSIVKIDNT